MGDNPERNGDEGKQNEIYGWGLKLVVFQLFWAPQTEASYCPLSVWLLCVSSIPNIKWLLCFFWAWKHIHTKGIWFHSWCYCVEGRPHISENSCVEMDGVRTHNLGNISTWKVERLREGYFSRSQGPLYLPPLRSQTETHMTVLLHAACWSLNIRRRAQLL